MSVSGGKKKYIGVQCWTNGNVGSLAPAAFGPIRATLPPFPVVDSELSVPLVQSKKKKKPFVGVCRFFSFLLHRLTPS